MTRTRLTLGIAFLGISVVCVHGQAPTPTSPTNSAPNPYRTVEHFFAMPEGRAWGSTSAVDIDRDGRSIWVADVLVAPNGDIFVSEGHGGRES